MRRRFRAAAVVAAVGSVLAGCSGVSVDQASSPQSSTATIESTTTTAPTTTTSEPTTTTTIDPMVELLGTMSTEAKVGQLLMPVLFGTSASAPDADQAAANRVRAGVGTMVDAVTTLQLGGVLYLGPNISDAAQTSALSSDLQAAATSVGLPPLLLSVDQEGGRVERLRDGVDSLAPARSFTPDAAATEAALAVMATQVAAQGINVVFAPVADLVAADENGGVIGDRSYGADPAATAAMVVAAVSGIQRSGTVAATVKHWPGHGATSIDSHASLPVIDVDPVTWVDRERVPFAAAVEAGVDLVMVGHLAFPQLDPSGLPATESPVLVDRLLRQELGFEGVVVSDALDMGAVQDRDPGELAVATIAAGVDILLASPDVAAARAALLAAVGDGRISTERLDASVLRILRLKEKLGLLD